MTPRIGIACLTLGALVLTGCMEPVAPDQPNRTRDGAIIGAILGGTAGLAGNGKNQGRDALVGAVIGGAIGGAIGNRLDQQAADLRRSMGNDQISVVNTGQALVVTMPQDILFATDSAALKPALVGDLRALAGNLSRYPDGTVEVIGHTDNTGSAAYNQTLSARRASTVAGVLIDAGVPSARLRSIGRGEDAPLASNLDAAGRAQNRRVEIVIRPGTT